MSLPRFQVFVHDWASVPATSPMNAAIKQSRRLGLKPGDSILVKDKKEHVRRYEIGKAPQILRPRGRTDR